MVSKPINLSLTTQVISITINKHRKEEEAELFSILGFRLNNGWNCKINFVGDWSVE